jgi:hypothetical protein
LLGFNRQRSPISCVDRNRRSTPSITSGVIDEQIVQNRIKPRSHRIAASPSPGSNGTLKAVLHEIVRQTRVA